MVWVSAKLACRAHWGCFLSNMGRSLHCRERTSQPLLGARPAGREAGCCRSGGGGTTRLAVGSDRAVRGVPTPETGLGGLGFFSCCR